MKYLVQKFGGTSLATLELREQVVRKIISAKNEGYTPVVVVSAIGRQGDPYATDTLLEFIGGINSDIPPKEVDNLLACGEIISGVAMVATLEKHGHRAELPPIINILMLISLKLILSLFINIRLME